MLMQSLCFSLGGAVRLGDLKRICYPIWIKLSGKVDGVNGSSQHSVALC